MLLDALKVRGLINGSDLSKSRNAQGQQSANSAGELHSRVVPRQSILPVTQKPLTALGVSQRARRVSAVSPPPRKKDSPKSLSRSRLRSSRKSAPAHGRHRRIASTDCTRAKCPSALSSSFDVRSTTCHTRTSCDCLAAASPGLPAGFYSGHTPLLRRLNHAGDHPAHRKPLRKPQKFLR